MLRFEKWVSTRVHRGCYVVTLCRFWAGNFRQKNEDRKMVFSWMRFFGRWQGGRFWLLSVPSRILPRKLEFEIVPSSQLLTRRSQRAAGSREASAVSGICLRADRAVDDVVHRARVFDAQLARHGIRLLAQTNSVNSED